VAPLCVVRFRLGRRLFDIVSNGVRLAIGFQFVVRGINRSDYALASERVTTMIDGG
jgi:hypothetical protein